MTLDRAYTERVECNRVVTVGLSLWWAAHSPYFTQLTVFRFLSSRILSSSRFLSLSASVRNSSFALQSQGVPFYSAPSLAKTHRLVELSRPHTDQWVDKNIFVPVHVLKQVSAMFDLLLR